MSRTQICHLITTPTEDGQDRITKSGHLWYGTGELVGALGGALELYESSSTEGVRLAEDGSTVHTPGPLAWVSVTRGGDDGTKPVAAFVLLGQADMVELYNRVGRWLALHGPDE